MPEIAERVRRELSDILASEAGRFAELAVITELLQSAERGDHPELVPALRERARKVFSPARCKAGPTSSRTEPRSPAWA
ncbi:hypothetical protein ACIOHB_06190 [Streptomyces microflavus]|uniref:hypothetical protein n=1 Tax=Streptomyces microflavus TaxID=1919 RepID=UPI00380ADCB7